MKKSSVFALAVFAALFFAVPAAAKDKSAKTPASKDIVLQKVDYTKGKTVLQAMKDRRSSREFSDKALDLQTLSELLWAAGGINREDGRRTFPTGMNFQEVDIYAFTQDGVYLYEPKENKLIQIVSGDKRAEAGAQAYVASAAVNLVYVADYARVRGGETEQNKFMSACDMGHISQNVYLYCASAELACVVRAMIDSEKLSKLLKLKETQKAMLAQSVGYAK